MRIGNMIFALLWWRPAARAPKDGSDFLTYSYVHDCRSVACWDAKRGQFRNPMSDWDSEEDFDLWMPLPPAPKDATGSRRKAALAATTGQSHRGSMIEVAANTGSAMLVSWLTNLWIVPIVTGAPLTGMQSWILVGVFTVLSLVRQYLWRRIGNRWFH